MLRNVNVLLFDPEGVHRTSLRKSLDARGHRVELHTRTDAAWNAWRSGAFPLLVVTAAEGLELCRRVTSQRLPGTACVLVFLDQGAAAGEMEAFLEAGADDLLTLPADPRLIELRLRLAEHRLVDPEELPFYRRPGFFRLLIDTMSEGLGVREAGGRIVYVNDHFCRMLGYARSEILGRPVSDFLEPSSAESFAEEMRKRPKSRSSSYELTMVRKNGERISTMHSGRAIHGKEGTFLGSFAVVTNVSERKRILARLLKSEDALEASEERFRALVQHTSDLISVVDRDGKLSYLSPASWTITGYPAHRRLGEDAFDLVHPDDRERLVGRFRTLVGEPGRQVQIEYRIRHRDGRYRVVESVMTNQLDNPAVGGVVANTRDVTDRKAAEDRLRHDALHDPLTALPNRVLFMDRLSHALDRGRRDRDYRSAVLFLDLDRFKTVNDGHGHAVGDRLLDEVGRRLAGCLRPNDTLARLGGDEFAVLLEDVKDPSDPVRVARRVQAVLQVPFDLDGREVSTSASIGIAVSPLEARSPEELLREADTAMYRAKSRGRSGYAIFDDRMHAQVRAQLKLETALRRAVDQWQFEVLYQPIVDLETGRAAGVEALVRWHHPERGVVLPKEFINLAEETGLITTLGSRVMAEACLQMRDWHRLLGEPAAWFVGVNLSRRQLAERDLADQVERVLEESGLPGDRLVLEVTETVVSDQADLAETTFERLKSFGVRLSLDDFGTGPSSLSLLHRFPFDMVKIDQWFVGNVGVEAGSDELVEGVMALCQWRRLATVAEGVETEDQRRRLRELGCGYAQGFLFAEPRSADEIESLLRKHL